MKRMFLTLLMLVSVFVASAQKDPAAIVAKSQKAMGVDKVDISNPDVASHIVVDIVEGAANNMSMDMIVQGTDKFYGDITVQGQEMTVIVNGDQGWMKVGEMVQPLPKESLQQQSAQAGVISGLQMTPEHFDFEYKGEVDGLDVVHTVDKRNGSISDVHFDAQGLISKIYVGGSDVEQGIVVVFSDYKHFGDMYIPSVFSYQVGGESMTSMKVLEYDYDCDVDASLFAEPK